MMRSNRFNRNISKSLLAFGLVLGASAPDLSAEDYSATYAWTFNGGNLIADWSFENESEELCKSGHEGGMWTDCHAGYIVPKSGSFAMVVYTGNSNGTETARSQLSDYLMCEPNTTYRLSFYVDAYWSDRGAANYPVVRFYKGDKSGGSSARTGDTYEYAFGENTWGWKQYSMTFTTGGEDAYLRLAFLESNSISANSSNYFVIDNVQLGRADSELGVTETRSYGDAAGRAEHTVESDGVTDLIAFNEFDERGRVVRAHIPASKARGLPQDLSAICVGSRSPGESLEYDFATLQDAYDALKTYFAGISSSEITTIPVINVVANTAGALAPIAPVAAMLTSLKDKNGNGFTLRITGIVKYSPNYAGLVSRHASTSVANGPYTFTEFLELQAKQYPGETQLYAQTTYPQPYNVVSTVSVPGTGYMLPGEFESHVDMAGWAMVNTLTPPATAEGYSVPVGQAYYIYKWEMDRQRNTTMSWSDMEGNVVKTGKSGKFTTLDYDFFGRLIGSNSPSGMYADKEWNAIGQVTATVDPDRGRWEYAYDKQGRQRFIHPPELGGPLATPTDMIANKYDNLGRIVESGKTWYNWHPTAVNNSDIYPSEWLDVGYYFDELNVLEFGQKSGVTLATMGLDPAKLTNTAGRLVAAYNRNSEVNAPGLTTAARKLSASFYAYDAQGRVEYVYRYLGQVENAADRLQKMKFVYDRSNRLESQIVFKNYSSNEASSVPSSESYYLYDDLGRVTHVLDKDSRMLAQYGYNSLGQVRSVNMYGKLLIGFQYDVRGQITKTDALRTTAPAEWIFSEEIGYDKKANPLLTASIPSPRWDGKISHVIRKFGKNVPKPVTIDLYNYTPTGALANHSKYSTNSANPLNNDGGINYPGLTFDWDNQDYQQFLYDADDNITTKKVTGGVVYNYAYSPYGIQNHQIKNISPGNRATGHSMTAAEPGNFQYDARGRMVKDVGIGKTIAYGFANDRPVLTSVTGTNFHSFYDEGFNRVAEIEEVSGVVRERKNYLQGNGPDVLKQITQRTATHPLGALDQTKNNLFGRGGIAGIEEEATGRKHLYIKDHLGSVVKVVEESTGDYLNNEELAYSAFGFPNRKVVDNGKLGVTGTFTGKEYEFMMKTYFFGARSFDPELGLWLSPDPIPSGMNPYAYAKDPLSYVDPNGEIAVFFVVLAAALASVAISYLNDDIHSFYDVGKAFTIGGITAAFTAGFLQTGGTSAYDFYSVNQSAAQVWGNAGLRVLGSRIPSTEIAPGVYVRPSFFMGSEGMGAGLDVNATVETEYLDITVGMRATMNASEMFSNKSGMEYNPYGGVTAKTGIGQFSAYHNQYFSGETSQSNNLFGYSNKYCHFRYQNDQDLGLHGGGDRWRSAAADVGLKFPGDLTISTGIMLYTGQAEGYGKEGMEGKRDLGGGRPSVWSKLGLSTTPKALAYEGFDKWHGQKAGVLFGAVTYKGQTNMMGTNSEAVRHAFQNVLVHKNMGVPYLLPDPSVQPQPFLMYRTHYKNTLY
jgi:RHS repeat-associated protein